MSNIPIVGPLFWNQFYTYTLAGFDLASRLFSAIQEVEKSPKYKALYVEPSPEKHQCIYCLRTSADFASEEHIFPESMGNDELILPKGFVCKDCNNGVLSVLDNTLLEFEPIAFLQVQFVSYKKGGEFPKARFQNVWFERTGPHDIRAVAQDKSGLPREMTELGDGHISFQLQMRGKTFHPKALARSLYKIGLGLVALSQGQKQACDSRYDEARDFIQKGEGFPNNLVMCRKCKPTPQVVAYYPSQWPGTLIFLSIFGLMFMFNLEKAPVMRPNEQLEQLHFDYFALNE
jgi:hypothetical protein